jgi:hypothetical protein
MIREYFRRAADIFNIFVFGYNPHIQGLIIEHGLFFSKPFQNGIWIAQVKLRILQANEFG